MRCPASPVSRSIAESQDFPTITFNAHESIEMPFRMSLSYSRLIDAGYVVDAEGQPILPPGMKEHLQKDLDRTIDDF